MEKKNSLHSVLPALKQIVESGEMVLQKIFKGKRDFDILYGQISVNIKKLDWPLYHDIFICLSELRSTSFVYQINRQGYELVPSICNNVCYCLYKAI